MNIFFIFLPALFATVISNENLSSREALTLNYRWPPIVRVITWNVADNARMGGKFDPDAIDAVLGVTNTGILNVADIYVIGLQELCWQCDRNNLENIANEFFNRLNSLGPYEVIGIAGTRMSDSCEAGCPESHGTTAIVVITKKGVVTRKTQAHFTTGCSDKGNQEKGVAYMKLNLKFNTKACFATSHLESRSPKIRRECLKNFLTNAERKMSWQSDFDFHFLFGDLNTRTAASAPEGQQTYFPPKTNFDSLRAQDELAGSSPFGQVGFFKDNMLVFLNSASSTHPFKESPFTFAPTYKLDVKGKEKSCAGRNPCYRSDRALSWTDRILHTAGISLNNYDSIHLTVSDHHPVFQDFKLK